MAERYKEEMTRAFLDTNVILRHILDDHSLLSAKARDIMEAIELGTITAWTSDLVIVEIVLVLSGKKTYNRSPEEIASVLVPIILLPHLQIPHKRVHVRACALFAHHQVDYIDAYNAALIEHSGETMILSFDTDFDAFAGIVRQEQP